MVNFEFCVLDTCDSLWGHAKLLHWGHNLRTTAFCPHEISLGQLPLDRSQKQASLECDISRPQCQAEKSAQSSWSTGPSGEAIGALTRYLLCTRYEETLWHPMWADGRALLGQRSPRKHETLTSIPQNHMKKLATVVGTQHPSIRALKVAGPSDNNWTASLAELSASGQ